MSIALGSASVCGGVAVGLAIASAGEGFPLEVALALIVLASAYLLFRGASKLKVPDQAAFRTRCPNVPSGNDKADFMEVFNALNAELLEDLESKEVRSSLI